MPTVSDLTTLLSPYKGANNSLLDRLNIVCSRLLEDNSAPGVKEKIVLSIYSDADGRSIITLPRAYRTVLAGAVQAANAGCVGYPLPVRNEFDTYADGGLGYGALSRSFEPVTGRFCVYQEWSDPMYLRFKFEVSEASGSIYIYGTLAGEDVYCLNTATWEKREKIAFSGLTAVTSTKLYDAYKLVVTKPTTLGRVTMYAVDSAGVETAVAVYEPTELKPQWRRYWVPTCNDVSPLSSSVPVTVTQFYTKDELNAMFSDAGTITVSASGTHDLVYTAYFLRYVRVVAQAGSGAYTHYFLLDNATARTGAIFRVALEMAASVNPTISICNNLVGNVLQTVTGDGNALYETLVFEFDGTDWRFSGREV